jgi:hypothetical protein
MTWLVDNNELKKKRHYDEIGLYAKLMNTIVDLLVNTNACAYYH